MKRLMVASLLATLFASSSGCCIIDKLLHCPCGRWRGGGCGPCCDDCAPCGGGCNDCNYTNGWSSGDGTWTEGTYSSAPSGDGAVYEQGNARPSGHSQNMRASYNARVSRPQRPSRNTRASYEGPTYEEGPSYDSGPVYESGPAYSESGPAYADSYGGDCQSCNAGPACGPGGGCGMGCCGGGRRGGGRQPFTGNSGPPCGAVGYPYYTTRGPRDFLARSPQPLGPY